ncbi:hypothetical protein B0H16DRAFT_1770704 [Mycena metata]|uniref:Uncharacterized protein n=1 Tax=Mycena metata TaxID=1033252 RepID=A0AAD7I0R8_9AGAR|nr:hypothetical protein B0H16DRAFT_1770704 [Mycena metata]
MSNGMSYTFLSFLAPSSFLPATITSFASCIVHSYRSPRPFASTDGVDDIEFPKDLGRLFSNSALRARYCSAVGHGLWRFLRRVHRLLVSLPPHRLMGNSAGTFTTGTANRGSDFVGQGKRQSSAMIATIFLANATRRNLLPGSQDSNQPTLYSAGCTIIAAPSMILAIPWIPAAHHKLQGQ